MNSNDANKRNQEVKKRLNKLVAGVLEKLRRIAKDNKGIGYEEIPNKLGQPATCPRCDGPPDPPRRRPPCIIGQDDDYPEVLYVFMPKPLLENGHKVFKKIFKQVDRCLKQCYPTVRLVLVFFHDVLNNRDGQSDPGVIYMKDPTLKWGRKKPPVEFKYYLLTTVDNPVEIRITFPERPSKQGEFDLDE